MTVEVATQEEKQEWVDRLMMKKMIMDHNIMIILILMMIRAEVGEQVDITNLASMFAIVFVFSLVPVLNLYCETQGFTDQKLSSTIFACCLSVRPASVTSPLIFTI